MEKLQLRLLVLIALGTISRCEEVDGPHPDSVAVMSSSATPPLGCGPPKPVNVRFNDIKVKGPDSDVVYHRVTVRDEHLQFAMNTSVSLPSDSFLECAKAAASEGSDAFTFEGSCTGYLLNLHFLKCQAGDLVVFVRAAYLDEEPAVVPFDEAPYKLVDEGDVDPYRVYMLSAFVEADEHLNFEKLDNFEGNMIPYSESNFIFRENGDIIGSVFFLLDLDSCLSEGAYGLELVVYPELSDIKRPYVYFFEECGNKVQIPESETYYKMLIFSHPGVGCKYYPSGLPDECTVTFEKEDSTPMNSYFGFFFSDNSDDGGLVMTINGSSPQTGKTLTKNLYRSNYYSSMSDKVTYEVSLLRHPSKRALGFFITFF